MRNDPKNTGRPADGIFSLRHRTIRLFCLAAFLSYAGVPAGLASTNESLFINAISYNDTCRLDRTALDSLYGSREYLQFPAIWELELEIGLQSDSSLEELEYKLAGFEDSWNKTTSHFIRYTNLPGREYELRLRIPGMEGRSKKFVFRTTEAEVGKIHETWWFQPLLTFCLLLIPFTIAYFLALDRSRRNLRLEVVRNQIASDLHDDVGANLGAINNLSDLLKKRHENQSPEARTKIIEKIKGYTRETITNLQDTVWAINPLNDSIEELLGKMKEFALLMLNAKEISTRYDSQYQPNFPIKLDMQQRHAMFMMFKEVINNIVKHAQAGEVAINIRNDKSSLSIEVQDNGVGFDPAVLHRGNGLKNFQNRARENFIDLDIQSEPGKGSRTRMVIHSLG